MNYLSRLIPLLCAIASVSIPALAAESNWSDKATSLSVQEYLELICAANFKNLNPTEPVEVSFAPGNSPSEALLFMVRPVVTPDIDLTNIACEKDAIIKGFRNNITKQADAYLKGCRSMMAKPSFQKRWSGASVDNNLVIRFVKSDNAGQTVALTANGKTTFDQTEINAQSKTIKQRAGNLWVQ